MDNQPDLTTRQQAIDHANKEAWKYRMVDSTRSLEFCKNACDLAEAINYPKGKAEGYRSLGFTYIRLSRHEEANILLEKSLDLFKELEDLEGQSDAQEYLGIIRRSLGDYSASLEFLFKSLALRKQTGYLEGESLSLYHLGVTYKYLGEYDKALNYLLEGLAVARSVHYWVSESYCLNLIGQVYYETAAYEKALDYYHQSLAMRKGAGDKWGEAGCLDNIGNTYYKINNLSEALDFCSQSLSISETISDKKGQSNALYHLANIHKDLNCPDEARNLCNKSLGIRKEIGDKKGEAEILLFLVDLQKEPLTELHKEALSELLATALKLGTDVNALDLLAKIHFSYYTFYKHYQEHEKALPHLELFMDVDKKLHKDALDERIQNLEITHRAERSKNEAEIYRLRNIELAELYEESKRHKEEIELQKRIVEDSMVDLKLTQKQLIQAEKMASLGELTAGIAHEIQNPLNFVNNFSELNHELIGEMRDEIGKGNFHEVKIIADEISKNEQKINHHGKRAEAIVKGMLLHSQSSTGKKEPIDINALADEYLRLSFHGLRAKDKTFNASLQTSFDKGIGKINIIPQDIGRVLLNLYNNAFYAVTEMKRLRPTSYEPTVSITTKMIDTRAELRVKDNGGGIPEKILDKIFQPFFTTKPPGHGTGLGLSLSYDIIKTHGGELKVETKEGEGTEFIIQLLV